MSFRDSDYYKHMSDEMKMGMEIMLRFVEGKPVEIESGNETWNFKDEEVKDLANRLGIEESKARENLLKTLDERMITISNCGSKFCLYPSPEYVNIYKMEGQMLGIYEVKERWKTD